MSLAYQPFAEALRVALSALDQHTRAAHVAACGGELRRLVPSLEAPAPMPGEADFERLRLFDAVIDLIRRLAAGRRAVLLILDDVHWAAGSTVQMLRHLLDAAIPNLLVVATYRDTEVDRTHALGSILGDLYRINGVERLALKGLDEDAVADLIDALAGDREMAGALHQRTAGNPFFTRQVLRHLAEGGGGDLPEGVLDVVGRRLSRLSDAANTALRTGAVAGQSFSARVLERVCDTEPLEEAVRARLLVDDGHGGYAFAHAIVRDALLRELSTARRAQLHRSVGRALVVVYGDDGGSHVADLAHHFTEAAVLGDAANAARYAVAAAGERSRQADPQGGLDVLLKARVAIEALEPVDDEARYEVCARQAELAFRAIRPDDDAVEAAAESARRLRSPERLLRVALVTENLTIGEVHESARRLVEDVLQLVGNEPSVTRAHALALRASHRAGTSDPRPDAHEALETMAAVGTREPLIIYLVVDALSGAPGAKARAELLAGSEEPGGRFRGQWARIRHVNLLQLGDRDGSVPPPGAVEYLTQRGDVNTLGLTVAAEVVEAFLDGRFDEVLGLADKFLSMAARAPMVGALHQLWVVAHARETGSQATMLPLIDAMAADSKLVLVHALHGLFLLEVGRDEDARDRFSHVMSDPKWIGTNWAPTILACASELAASLGEREEGARLFAEVDPYEGEVLTAAGAYVFGAADRFRGMLLSLLDRHDEAVAALEAALAVEEAMRAPSLEARTLLWLARAILARGEGGDSPRAKHMLARCVEIADRIGMRGVAADAREAATKV